MSTVKKIQVMNPLSIEQILSVKIFCVQDPVIFSGTVRSNLDPFNTVLDDHQIWAAIKQAGLLETVKSMPVSFNTFSRSLHLTIFKELQG